MKLLKANALECKADVRQRCIFRIVWLTIPGAALAFASPLLGLQHLLSVYYFSVIIAVPLLGALVDGVRLKAKGSSNM